MKSDLKTLQDAIGKSACLGHYKAWPLLDKLERSLGHSGRFGITLVNFQTQKRTIKDSGLLYA